MLELLRQFRFRKHYEFHLSFIRFFNGQSPYSSLAQSVERMTVNHDVVGSSPTGGARKKALANASAFFQ